MSVRDADDSLLITRKAGSICLVTGSVLFAAASLLHPRTFDPTAPLAVVRAIQLHPDWSAIHWAAAVGILLLTLGLTAISPVLQSIGRIGYAPYSSGMAWVSLALWLWVFAMEAAGWPALTATLKYLAAKMPEDTPVLSLIQALWAGSLGIGYLATALLAVAALLWAVEMVGTPLVPRWVGAGILILAPSAVLGLVPAWLFPDVAIFSLIPTGLLFLWFVLLGLFLWPRRATGPLP